MSDIPNILSGSRRSLVDAGEKATLEAAGGLVIDPERSRPQYFDGRFLADDETALAAARTTAISWAATRPDVAILDVTGSVREVTVTVIGRDSPEVGDLEADLRTTLPQAMITIQWVSGGQLVTVVPTPAPRPPANRGESAAPTPPR